MSILTRRQFLETVTAHSIGARFAATALLSSCVSSADRSSALGLDAGEARTLLALIDQIIPATDGSPAASEAGTLSYFEALAATNPDLVATLRAAIRRVDEDSHRRVGGDLPSLSSENRTAVVSALSVGDQSLFDRLRTYVYEGYYLQPRVWSLLGYEPYPTGSPGPAMSPFDPALLDRVRTLPAQYREV
jgi:hypothetical protein